MDSKMMMNVLFYRFSFMFFPVFFILFCLGKLIDCYFC